MQVFSVNTDIFALFQYTDFPITKEKRKKAKKHGEVQSFFRIESEKIHCTREKGLLQP
jgi:hypothetical protein